MKQMKSFNPQNIGEDGQVNILMHSHMDILPYTSLLWQPEVASETQRPHLKFRMRYSGLRPDGVLL